MNKNKPYDYRVYTYKSELDKAIHTLEGMLKGIAIDNEINQEEISELRSWYFKYEGLIDKHPFSELIPALTSAFANNLKQKPWVPA